MFRRFTIHILVSVLLLSLCAAAFAQAPPTQPQPLTPEERRARIVAACDAMITTYMTLVMLESPRQRGEVERMLLNLSHSPFFAVCYSFGWRWNGMAAWWPLPGAGAGTTTTNPYPASAQSPGLGQAWQWTGHGLCKVEYEGYTQADQAIEPAPPTESQETLKAHWDESQKAYILEIGCTRIVSSTRSGRFNDTCAPRNTTPGAPAQPGCITKCRPDMRVPDGQLSMEAGQATVGWESEDPVPAAPGSAKFRTSCTFAR